MGIPDEPDAARIQLSSKALFHQQPGSCIYSPLLNIEGDEPWCRRALLIIFRCGGPVTIVREYCLCKGHSVVPVPAGGINNSLALSYIGPCNMQSQFCRGLDYVFHDTIIELLPGIVKSGYGGRGLE